MASTGNNKKVNIKGWKKVKESRKMGFFKPSKGIETITKYVLKIEDVGELKYVHWDGNRYRNCEQDCKFCRNQTDRLAEYPVTVKVVDDERDIQHCQKGSVLSFPFRWSLLDLLVEAAEKYEEFSDFYVFLYVNPYNKNKYAGSCLVPKENYIPPVPLQHVIAKKHVSDDFNIQPIAKKHLSDDFTILL